MNEFVTKNAEETQKLGYSFAKRLNLGQGLTLTEEATVLCLYGDLGAGKTTFLQGFAKGLGIKKRIISPTFIIVRQYYCHPERSEGFNALKRDSLSSAQNDSSITNFYHIDLYRTETLDDLRGIGLEEILADKNAVVAIEWAEKLSGLLPEKRLEIKFEYIDENKRKITFRHPGKRSASRISSEEILDKPE